MSSTPLTSIVSVENQESISQFGETENYLIHMDSPEEIEEKKKQMKESLLARAEADPDKYQEWLAQKHSPMANDISPMFDQPDIYLPFDLSDVIGGYTKIGDRYDAPGERLSLTLNPNDVIQDMASILPENFSNLHHGNSPYGEVRYLNDEGTVLTHEMNISEPSWSYMDVIGYSVSDEYFSPYGDDNNNYYTTKEGFTKVYFEFMVTEMISYWDPVAGGPVEDYYYYNQIYPIDVFIGDSMGSNYSDLWSVDGVVQDWLFESYKSSFCYDPVWEIANSYTDIDICDFNADFRGASSVNLFGSGFNNSNGGEKKIPPIIRYISASSVDLDFSNSDLTGELPQSLSQIKAAKLNLDLSENQLSGNIITDYPNISTSAELTVKDNQFTGFTGEGINLDSIDLGINFLNRSDISGLVQKGITCYGDDKQYQVNVNDLISVGSGDTVNTDFLKNHISIILNGQDYTPRYCRFPFRAWNYSRRKLFQHFHRLGRLLYEKGRWCC